MPPARPRPSGQTTRGKTALNRLRQVDVFVALAMPRVLKGASPLAVDVGFGARAWTTLEMAERWRRIEPSLRVLGLEIDPDRVAEAASFAAPPTTDFRLGGFNLTASLGKEKARVVRCYNVLRQYQEDDVAPALAQMAQAIEPQGVLVEGTSNPTGGMTAFDVYRRDEHATLTHEHLVFATNFKEALSPADFQTILPKRLIHRMLEPTPARFFADWQLASQMALEAGPLGTRRHWVAAAALLRERFGHSIDRRPRLLERGYLVLESDLTA